ncbi:MAG: hypothetical protein M1827_003114 [Pycnora praestabilis]|nr:MAG: hypothetical protein M1827_003114 [Pycnora praestabilis]
MALFFSHQAVNIVQWLSRTSSGDTASTPTFVQRAKQSIMHGQNWREQLLLLDTTVEFPFIVSIHPMVHKHSINDSMLMPGYTHLLAQMLVFLVIDHMTHQFFARHYPIFSTDTSEPAFVMSTDFTVTRTSLLLSILIIQSSPIRDLHFVVVVGWMLLRRSEGVSHLFKVKS